MGSQVTGSGKSSDKMGSQVTGNGAVTGSGDVT